MHTYATDQHPFEHGVHQVQNRVSQWTGDLAVNPSPMSSDSVVLTRDAVYARVSEPFTLRSASACPAAASEIVCATPHPGSAARVDGEKAARTQVRGILMDFMGMTFP